MIQTLREIWTAILTPSRPDEAAYDRLVISLGHAVLGGCFAMVTGWIGLPLFVVPILYWLAKELPDLRRGGSLRDGLWDTAAIALGAAYGAWWWPAAAIVLALSTALDRKGFRDAP